MSYGSRGYPAYPPPVSVSGGFHPRPRPGWVTALGIISIILGSLGFLSSIYNLAMPAIMRMQTRMMEAMEEDMAALATQPTSQPSVPPGPPPGVFRMWRSMFSIPRWAEVALYVLALAGIVLSVLCLASGIGMLGLRPWGRGLGIVYAVGTILQSVCLLVVTAMAATWMLWGWTCGGIIGVAYPIVLLCFLLPRHRAAWFRGAARSVADYTANPPYGPAPGP